MADAYVLNQFPTTYGAAMSLLAEMLVSSGWTYQASGDGLSGYSSSGKIFTNTVSGAALSWSNPKAWARLQGPLGREFILQHNNDATARIKYAASGGFTGGSPAAAVTPSSTEERVLRGAGTDAAPTFSAWFTTNVLLGQSVFQGCSKGSAPYGFWFGGQETPGGAKQAFLMLDPLEGAAPEDTDPYVIAIAHTNAGFANTSNMGRAGGTAGTWTTANGAAVEGCFAHMDVARSVFAYVQPCQWMWTTDGRVVTGGTATLIVGGVTNCFINPFNGKVDSLPLLYNRMQIGATANPGQKGWSRFQRWIGMSRSSFCDTADNKNWIAFGHVWLPWDGATQPRG